MELAVLKATVGRMREKYAFSERRACRLMRLSVTSYRYESQRRDEPLRTKLVELGAGEAAVRVSEIARTVAT